MMVHSGWYQVAFSSELSGPVAPAHVGGLGLALAAGRDGRLRAFEATCPHRGANLARGGVFDGDAVFCPFHGYRIRLGEQAAAGFCVREFPVLTAGGLVFVRLSADDDRGFAARIAQLEQSCGIFPGFSMPVRARYELVAENAYDGAHFQSVHRVGNYPEIAVKVGEHRELVGEGVLHVPPSRWQRGSRDGSDIAVPLTVRAYSPGLVVADMGGDDPYTVLTAATPDEDGCVIRLSLAVPRAADGSLPEPSLCDYLLKQTRRGLEQDRLIWESIDPRHRARLTEADAGVAAFREFCTGFAESRGG